VEIVVDYCNDPLPGGFDSSIYIYGLSGHSLGLY
jgi:hypothetical protein